MSRPRSGENVYRAIADNTRRRMLDMLLRQGDLSVGEIVQAMRLRKSVASFHLATLMAAGVVKQRRRGRTLMCSVDHRPLAAAYAWLGMYMARRPSGAARTVSNAAAA